MLGLPMEEPLRRLVSTYCLKDWRSELLECNRSGISTLTRFNGEGEGFNSIPITLGGGASQLFQVSQNGIARMAAW